MSVLTKTAVLCRKCDWLWIRRFYASLYLTILNRNKKRHTTHVWIALDPYVYTVCLLPKTNVFNEYCSLVSKKTNLGFPNTLNGDGWMDIFIRMKYTYHSLNILFNWKLIAAAAVVATTAFGILYRIDLDFECVMT